MKEGTHSSKKQDTKEGGSNQKKPKQGPNPYMEGYHYPFGYHPMQMPYFYHKGPMQHPHHQYMMPHQGFMPAPGHPMHYPHAHPGAASSTQKGDKAPGQRFPA